MNWTDPRTNDFTEGFAERGFLPSAMLNMLAMLGWNDGTGQELFSLDELVARFDIGRVNHSGAVFDFEKARWFNHQHIQGMSAAQLAPVVKPLFEGAGITVSDARLDEVIELIKERCTLLPDFVEQGAFFFKAPETIDTNSIKGKWKAEHETFFEGLAKRWEAMVGDKESIVYEADFNGSVETAGIKKGEVMLPLRIMLVGGKFGPGVFDIVRIIGGQEAAKRIRKGLSDLANA
jgi:glutamyl-tRNA synthetase